METRAKLSTKILSLFLSVLMALGCFTVALPGLVPEAEAATWQQLKNAFNVAYNNGVLSQTYATKSGTNIRDDSKGGYLYNIAELIAQIAAQETGNANHNALMRQRIKNYVGGLNSYQQNFVDLMLPVDGNYQYHTNYRYSLEGGKNGGAPNYQLSGSASYTVTVTRTLDAAIRNDYPGYDDINRLPGSIDTSVTLSGTATRQSTTSQRASNWATTHQEGSGTDAHDVTDRGTDYYTRRYEWYTNNTPGVSYGNTGLPVSNALKEYRNYVNGAFKSGYDAYAADKNVIYSWSVDTLKSVEPPYNTVRNKINGIYPLYIELYFGQSEINNRDAYAKACTGAVEAKLYEPYVNWILYGTPMAGKDNKDAYDATPRNPANRAQMVKLREQATQMRDTVEALDEGTKTALRNVYGYNVSYYNNYINTLTNEIQVYDLTDIYDEVMFRIDPANDETMHFQGKPEVWGIKNHVSKPYTDAGQTCPVTDELLANAISWFSAKRAALRNNFNQANVNAVFGADLARMDEAMRQLDVERQFRHYEDDFNNIHFKYFESIRYIDYSKVKDTEVERVILEAEGKYTNLFNQKKEAISNIGKDKADQIYGTYDQEMRAFINSLYNILYERTYEQHRNMVFVAHDLNDNDKPDGKYADEIYSDNFSLVKRAVADIDDDLYTWVLHHNGTNRDMNIVTEWHNLKQTYLDAVNAAIARAWNDWTQVRFDDHNGDGIYDGTYVIRDPVVQDMVRDPEETMTERYVVTDAKIETVIKKLDVFLTSDSFAKLIGVYRDTPEWSPQLGITLPAVHNLSQFIESLLMEKLFNDNMVNTIVALLFPMLSDTLINTIKDALKDLGPMSTSPYDADADAAILLSAIPGANQYVTAGKLDVYIDGKKGTQKLHDVFANLGIKVFPVHFANVLANTANGKAGKYNDIIWQLRNCNNDWKNFDFDGDNEVTAKDLSRYKWGVTDYNSFVTVIGDVFSSVLPILQAVFTSYNYSSPQISNLLHAIGRDVHAEYKGIKADIDGLEAKGHATLSLSGIPGYSDLWAPIFEALNITASKYTMWPDLDYPLSSQIGTSGGSCSAAQLVNALFTPLLKLVKTLAAQPIDTVLGILPNVAQYVSYDMIQPLLGALTTKVGLKATIEVTKAGSVKAWGWLELGWLADWLKGIINDNLKDVVDVSFPLELGGLIDLHEMLKCDISDFNAILEMILKKNETDTGIHRPISFPPINSGTLASLGELQTVKSLRTQNFSAPDLGGGWRYFIKADKADVLYDILRWLLDFVAIDGNLSGLMVSMGKEPLGPEVDAILAGISPRKALAALIELFLPQDYNFAPYKWYVPGVSASKFNLSQADFVYLKYANNWTRDKAVYFYNNLDSVTNQVINMVDPNMLQGKEGINELLLEKINAMFNNQGIMNVINLCTGIGNSLADKPEIVDMVKDQLTFQGSSQQLDLMLWYNSFGYLTYDYDYVDPDTGEKPANPPKKPGEPGYVKDPLFSNLEVTVTDTGTTDPETGKVIKEYHWTYKGVPLVDGAPDAREIFTHIFCDLFRPFSPAFSLILTGQDLQLFKNALVINGYKCYKSAIVPLFEVAGINDAMTQEEYDNYCRTYGADKGFDLLVNKLFDKVNWILSTSEENVNGMLVELGPIQKIINLLPNLFYFIQSGGLSTVLKNLLQPIWALVDTLRPIADVNLDAFLHKFLASYMKLNYDVTDTVNYPTSPVIELLASKMELNPVYDAAKAEKDKPMVDGIFSISVENLSLTAIFSVVKMMFGIDLAPLEYAFEGMCVPFEADGTTYGVEKYASKSGLDAYRLNYHGADTITVVISVLLDVLRYKDNAENIDKMAGLVKPADPDAPQSNITAKGLLEALLVVFEDKADWDHMKEPNWDYLLENKTVDMEGLGSVEWADGDYNKLMKVTDLNKYHSINNLAYVTDWTEDTAKATDEMLKVVLDYLIPKIDKATPPAKDFEEFVTRMLNEKVYSGELLRKLADAMASIFNKLPVELVSLIDNTLDIRMSDWYRYVSEQNVEKTDADGKVTIVKEFAARPEHEWWKDKTAAAYVDTKDEFVAAAKKILLPVSKLLAVIFLGEDYRLFYTIGDSPVVDKNPGNGYGKDAIVLNGANAYAKGLIPLLEALGLHEDLMNYKPSKYRMGEDANGNAVYNNDLFVTDLFDILVILIDKILADPVNWLIEILPGLVYYINANGVSTALENIFGSLRAVIDAVNTMLPADKQIDLKTLVPGIDLTQLNLSTLFGILESKTGIHIRKDIEDYMKELYVGELYCDRSANEKTDFFTMKYSNVEERHDMITILLALIIELLEDKGEYTDANGAVVPYDNAAAIDKLLTKPGEENKGTVGAIVDAIKNPDSVVYKDIKWNYFDETIDLADKTQSDGSILVPGYLFQYLNYTTDWTYDKAVKVEEGFEGLLLAVVGMATKQDVTGKTLSDIVKQMAGMETVYSGATLQKVLDLVSPILFGENAVLNETLVELLGCMLGAELTQWNYQYAFENPVAGETYTLDAETGLEYRMAERMKKVVDADGNPVLDAEGKEQFEPTGEMIKTYAIDTQEEFIKGATILFQPAYRLLSWLFFGDSYEFFNGNTAATKDEVLITLQGTDGYKEGLALLLEALGCRNLKEEAAYKTVDAKGNITTDMAAFVTDLATSLFGRIDEILADPANEVVNLLPELLYFINAGGLQVSISNILAGPLALVNQVAPITGMGANLDEIVQTALRKALKNDTITFTMDGINLQYIFGLVETLTGLEITNVAGNKLDKFYMGEIISYASASEKLAYKMRFSTTEDFADFITVLLSFLVDVALYDGNAAVIEKLAKIEPGMVQGIVNFLKTDYTIEVKDIDWFYFDPTVNPEGLRPGDKVTVPGRTINYLTYASDWTEEAADYVFQHRNDIIAAALSMTGKGDTTVAQIIAEKFDLNRDLYTAANLNKILNTVKGAVGGLDAAITDLAGVIMDIDLTAYKTMPEFTAEQIVDRNTFVVGLTQVISPVYKLLDWLLFADNMQFFDKCENPVNPHTPESGEALPNTPIEILIDLKGAEGYAYGLVPILEALGVQLPDVKADSTTEDVFFPFVNNLLARIEAILANPVDEVLALLPNLIYFINTNGLATCLNNLLGGVFVLLDEVNKVLPPEKQISIEALLSKALQGTAITVDMNKLDLLALVEIAEQATGLKIADVVTAAKIDKFYLGQMVYYKSANGKNAYRMEYSEKEGGAEMLTILLNFVVELVLYKDAATGKTNAEVLETMLKLEPGTIQKIIDIIPTLGAEPNYTDYDWNYMGGTVDPNSNAITLPATPFLNYFTYETTWTQEKANYIYDNMDSIITAVLRMTGAPETADTVKEILAGKFNLYTAANLNKILEQVKVIYTKVDKRLLETVGVILGVDLTAWDGMTFNDADIYDAETFVQGVVQVLSPVYTLLDWLLFADNIEYFVKSEDGTTTLIKVAGVEGYKYGLVPLLEALGIKLPEMPYHANCANMFEDVLKAIFARIDAILANPVDEVLALIPNLLYFINANGVSTAVNNLLGSVMNILDVLNEKGIVNINLTELLGGIDINKLDLAGIFAILETKVPAIAGLEINNAFKGNVSVASDGKVSFVHDINGENIIEKFYLGSIESFVSTNGDLAYRMVLPEGTQGDLLTFILSFALDLVAYNNNSKVIDKMAKLPEGTVGAILTILAEKMEFTMGRMDWVYFLNLTEAEKEAKINEVLAGKLNNLPALPDRTLHYIEYDNNWNEETAEYLVNNLPDIVDLVIAMATESPDLDAFIKTKVDIYSDATVNMIVAKIANMLKKVNTELLVTLGTVLDADLQALVNYKATGVHDKATFVAALTDAFGNIGFILDWLLFDRDMTFFTKLEDGTPAKINLAGNEGYKYGLAPLLQAIGVDTHIGTLPAATEEVSVTEQVLSKVLTNVCDRIDEILADPIPQVIDLLLELLYFINADGVRTCALNLVAPVNELLNKVVEATGNQDLTLAKILKFDINTLDLEGICGLLKQKVGIDVYGAVGGYLSQFYFGELKYYESFEGIGGFHMVYTATEQRHDMITIVLSVLLDTLVYPGNHDAIVKLLGEEKGEEIYKVVMAFLTNGEIDVPMQNFSWIMTEHADTGKVLSPITQGSIYNYMYGPLYTREMGAYITKWLPHFVDTMIVLLGVEDPNGGNYKGLEDILDQLLGKTIYKAEYVQKILDTVQGLVAKIKTAIGPELFAHANAVLTNALGVDLTFWDNYTIGTIAEGDRNAFVNEIVRILTPAYPILEFLLTDEDLAFFNKDTTDPVPSDKNSYVVINGAEGYAYAIIPLLEALHCANVLTPAEYVAAKDADPQALLKNIINPLLDKVDEVLADPIHKIFEILPGLIYFLNSNGLDTVFKNLINAGLDVLKTVEPLTGEIDLYEKIGFDFQVNIEGLIDQALKKVEQDTGFKLTKIAMEAITELTAGKVVSFTSKNGQIAYTMEYAPGADQVDLVTIVLRLLLTFVSIDENAQALKVILADKLNAEGYKFVCSLLDNFSQMVDDPKGMDEVMYTVYWIFYSANVAATETENWLGEFNGDYSFLNQLFATSDLAFLRQLEKSLGDLLNKYTGDIIDDDELAPNGFIKFFKQIAAFFQKIIDFFRNLFK